MQVAGTTFKGDGNKFPESSLETSLSTFKIKELSNKLDLLQQQINE